MHFIRTLLTLVLLVLTLSSCVSPNSRNHPSPSFGRDTGFPGIAPGSPVISCQGTDITVSNAVFSIGWNLTKRGLRASSIRDEESDHTLMLTGEVFQVVLANDNRYAASALAPIGKPRVKSHRPRSGASSLAQRIPGKSIELPLRSADGQLRVVWRAIIHDDANYVRQEIDITPLLEDCVIKEVVWLNENISAARTAGQVDGSPVVAGNFFFGSEDPHALNRANFVRQEIGARSPDDLVQGKRQRKVWPQEEANLLGTDGRVSCLLRRDALLRRDEKLTQSFVWGVAPPGQMRRAFLYYLERERAHPYRPFLHYNSWYDTAWSPFALNETNCLEAIQVCGERFIERHDVVMDAMVFDDGWDDPRTLWQFHSGFPKGFAPLAKLCKQNNTRLGVWLSPFGGYGKPKEDRLRFGREQGYEINATGFSMSGPKYYAAFKKSCVHMIRKYGVNHFKFDGIAAGTYASGGADYILDTEAMRRLMLELREEDPNLYINLTTGSWPSPFWLRYADSLWRQGGDMGFSGKGPKQQQWLTYRDEQTYRNIVRKSRLYPLNSLMTQGVAYSRQGTAGDSTFNSEGFKDDVHAFFGSGTGLQELYIQPGKLTDEDWQVLVEAAKWSRANADVLVDTHWIGGDPSKLEVYGYASWSPRKGVVMLRNPDDREQEFLLDVVTAFEFPPDVPTMFALKSPWAEDASNPTATAESGKALRLTLKPFEVVVLDALPAQ